MKSFRAYHESVVQIYDRDDNLIGTGVIIAQQYVLTCGHIVCDALSIDSDDIESTHNQNISVGLYSSNSIQKIKQQAKVLHAILDEDTEDKKPNDVALLVLEKKTDIFNYPLIEIDKNHLEVIIYGFDVSDGRWVEAEYLGNNHLGWGQIKPKDNNNRMNEGFSGSPVWDDENNGIVGIIVAKRVWDEENQDMLQESYMIPSSTILKIDEFKKYLGSYIRPRNPYKGLNAFLEKDSQFYFGRDDDIEKIIPKLDSLSKNRFFSIIGISGVGKSSFINAGLIPKLKNNFQYTVISFRPNSNPFEEVILKLLEYLEKDKTKHAKKMREMEADLSNVENISIIRDHLKIISKDISPIILIIDQFEELFTNSTKEVQSLFLMQLLEVINDKDLPVKTLISMRVDFLEKLLNHPKYTELLNNDSKYFIGNLATEKLKNIILKPANKLNVKFEEGLVERILTDIKDEKGQLPLLEFALTKLWDTQEYGVITHKALDELGGVLGSLGKYANDVYNKFETEEEKESVKRVMIQLVHPGLGKQDTRQIITLDKFIEEDKKTIYELANKRLIVTGTSSKEDNEYNKQHQKVEIIHEALISQWSDLIEWREEYREFRIWQNKLRLTVDDWGKGKNYDESYLLRGRLLEDAEEKLKDYPKELEAERDFIEKSLEVRDIQLELEKLEVNKKIKRNRQIKAGVTIFVISLSLLTFYSVSQKKIAESQKNIADKRLSTIGTQQNQILWTYFSSFLDTDRQDEKIDDPKVLNTVLNISDYTSENKIKAIDVLMKKGIAVLKQEKPMLSKNSADFVVFISRLYVGDLDFFNKNINELSTNFVWLWTNDEINLFSNLLTRLINKENLNPIEIQKEDIEKYKYLINLMNFISKPSENNLDKLSSFKTFFMVEDEDKKIIKGGLEAIFDYDNQIISNHFHFKKTKLLTGKESKEISENFSKIIDLSNFSDKNKETILSFYKKSKNAYLDSKKSKLTKEGVKKIAKVYLDRVQKISESLYWHSQKNPDKYTYQQRKSIKDMYDKGIYKIKTDTISQKYYPDLNKNLPIIHRQKYLKFKELNSTESMKEELESIFQLEQSNPWALNALSKLFFDKDEKDIELFAENKDFLQEWKKTIILVLNNQNLNKTIDNVTKKEKRNLANMYEEYANYYNEHKNQKKEILNIRLSLNYSLDNKEKASKYGRLTWDFIFIKNYTQAIINGEKGVKLYPKLSLGLTENLAHAYLLHGDIEKAKNIYLNPKYKNKIFREKTLWKDLIRNDFKTFRENNITNPYFDEIEKLLFISE